MPYVMDTNSFIWLGGYYPVQFPSFWKKFDPCVDAGEVISVKMVRKEFMPRSPARKWLDDWVNRRSDMFHDVGEETEFVRKIFEVPHFRALVPEKDRKRDIPIADPFVIAKAWHLKGSVITEEEYKQGAARIPNVCKHFGIKCMTFQEFMQEKKWVI